MHIWKGRAIYLRNMKTVVTFCVFFSSLSFNVRTSSPSCSCLTDSWVDLCFAPNSGMIKLLLNQKTLYYINYHVRKQHYSWCRSCSNEILQGFLDHSHTIFFKHLTNRTSNMLIRFLQQPWHGNRIQPYNMYNAISIDNH